MGLFNKWEKTQQKQVLPELSDKEKRETLGNIDDLPEKTKDPMNEMLKKANVSEPKEQLSNKQKEEVKENAEYGRAYFGSGPN